MLPQLIYLALGLIGLGIECARHGEEKKKKYDGWTTFFAMIIIWAILLWGGFWQPLLE